MVARQNKIGPMIEKTLHASSHQESHQGKAMTQSTLVRRVAFAAGKGATALSCLALIVAAALATPEQAARDAEAASRPGQPQAKTGGAAQSKAKASTKQAWVTDLRGDYDWHRANND